MTIGVMQILQTDNGREFKGALLLLMKQHNVRIKHGRPRTPQTQGLVEQANGTVKHQIRTYQSEDGTQKWANVLSKIAYNINTTWCEALPYGITPYEALFSRKPHRNPDMEEIKEMLGGVEEEEILQGLTEESAEIEELLDLIPQEETFSVVDDNDDRSEEEGGIMITESNSSDDNNSASEIEDRLLDCNIHEKNAKNRERMMEKYSKQHTVEVFKKDDIVMLRIPKEDLCEVARRHPRKVLQ